MAASTKQKNAAQLREILSLLSTAGEKIAFEWEKAPENLSPQDIHDTEPKVSHAEYEAVKIVLAAVGSLQSMVTQTHMYLNCISTWYLISRCLHIVVGYNVAEMLAGVEAVGLHTADLARSTGIEEKKMCETFSMVT
jgi:hypothetical protein